MDFDILTGNGQYIKYQSSYTVEPHLSGLFTYPDTCLGTIYEYIYRKCLTYPDSHLGNGGVRISEAPLYNLNSRAKVTAVESSFIVLD